MGKYLVEKKDVKQFKGYMTAPIRLMYEEDYNKIRFRSSVGETGNTSRINIKGRKYGVYATVDTADALKKLSDENPRSTVGELAELAKATGKGELIEVANYFLKKECRGYVPVIELDKDKLRK